MMSCRSSVSEVFCADLARPDLRLAGAALLQALVAARLPVAVRDGVADIFALPLCSADHDGGAVRGLALARNRHPLTRIRMTDGVVADAQVSTFSDAAMAASLARCAARGRPP
jgi:hypothetical protein